MHTVYILTCKSSCVPVLEAPELRMSTNPLLSYFIFFCVFFSVSNHPLLTSLSVTCLWPRMIWILIVFLQLLANVAMGECNGAITRQSHPICRGYEGEFVCFSGDRGNLYCQAVPMKRPSKGRKPLRIQDYGVEAHWKSNGLVTSNRVGRSMLRWVRASHHAHTKRSHYHQGLGRYSVSTVPVCVRPSQNVSIPRGVSTQDWPPK